jgi:hypothetical protein
VLLDPDPSQELRILREELAGQAPELPAQAQYQLRLG